MHQRTIDILVGLFVVLAVVSFSMLAFQVSGLATFYEREPGYEIKAYFEEIGGLKPRARVAIAGVAVGRVTDIRLDTQSFSAIVTMHIDSKFNAIPSDSSAIILTSGLIGDNYIELEPGAETAALQNGSVISETQSAMILERLIGQFLLNKVEE